MLSLWSFVMAAVGYLYSYGGLYEHKKKKTKQNTFKPLSFQGLPVVAAKDGNTD